LFSKGYKNGANNRKLNLVLFNKVNYAISYNRLKTQIKLNILTRRFLDKKKRDNRRAMSEEPRREPASA